MRKERPQIVGRTGFTLIEVMIVLAILAALIGIVAFNVVGTKKKAKVGEARLQLGKIKGALERFNMDFDRYPTDDEGIKVLWDKESLSLEDGEGDEDLWERYITPPTPEDPWGNEWGYRAETEHEGEPFDLWSNGPDGEEGTEDDLVSWYEDEEGTASSSSD